jgi:dTDP-4-amino-4,6-dideoxygalactose transaminase
VFRERRQSIADAYDRGFAGLPVITSPRAAAGDTHAWHLYVLRLADHARSAATR